MRQKVETKVKNDSLAKERKKLKGWKCACGSCKCLFGACDLHSPVEAGILCSKNLGAYIAPKWKCPTFQALAA